MDSHLGVDLNAFESSVGVMRLCRSDCLMFMDMDTYNRSHLHFSEGISFLISRFRLPASPFMHHGAEILVFQGDASNLSSSCHLVVAYRVLAAIPHVAYVRHKDLR
jgi:hypothetical protein